MQYVSTTSERIIASTHVGKVFDKISERFLLKIKTHQK